MIKAGIRNKLFVDDNRVLFYIDESTDLYGKGEFGIRQIYRSIITYDNFKVFEAEF